VTRLAHVAELIAAALAFPLARVARLIFAASDRVVICGWWGSETVGDVAILGQLLTECDAVAPRARVTLVSFDRTVSRETLRDLGRENIELLGVGLRSGWAAVSARCLIFGGGPLMESPRMPLWALRARLARWGGTRVMLYACGIGPVRSARVTRSIASLVRSATEIVLRDRASIEWHDGLARRAGATLSFDPAFDFVRNLSREPAPGRRSQLALALREPPSTYLGDLDRARATEQFLDLLAETLKTLMAIRPLNLVGCVMHTGFADGDDHSMYERLRTRLAEPEKLQVAPGRHSIHDVVHVFRTSQAVLAVRFHAMILALASNTPFVAVDYARPQGKASAAAELVGRGAQVMPWDRLDAEELARQLQQAVDSTVAPPDLSAARAARLGVLQRALR
jgi:polysaccharide pyruvyl transferase WcaK-like protein